MNLYKVSSLPRSIISMQYYIMINRYHIANKMGSIISKFQKKKSTQETLEIMEKEIDKLEENQNRNRDLQKSIVLSFLIFSVILYVLAAVIFYLWYFPKKWLQRLLYLLPFIGFPVLIFFLKKLLHFIFVTRIARNARTLANLKKEKKRILENVMETETYKVAKDILQRFDPKRKLVEQDFSIAENKTPSKDSDNKMLTTSITTSQVTPVLRNKPPQVTSNNIVNSRNGPQLVSPGQQGPTPNKFLGQQGPSPYKIAAPILPQNRSAFDKIAEYFVGDGPSNRYALICKQCFSHNGMALAEEFEFISYKCCYCNTFNQARKQRSHAPKLSQHDSDQSDSDHSKDKLNINGIEGRNLKNIVPKEADEAIITATDDEHQDSKKIN
ncbi:endoplasmic reticulum junction formation protein lunapark-B isoform X1 [Hydra vulgaris]